MLGRVGFAGMGVLNGTVAVGEILLDVGFVEVDAAVDFLDESDLVEDAERLVEDALLLLVERAAEDERPPD